jgi:CspA family cold shock protein
MSFCHRLAGSRKESGLGFSIEDIIFADGVFVHIAAVEKAGYTNLVEGAKVSHELFTVRSGKASAENLRRFYSAR